MVNLARPMTPHRRKAWRTFTNLKSKETLDTVGDGLCEIGLKVEVFLILAAAINIQKQHFPPVHPPSIVCVLS